MKATDFLSAQSEAHYIKSSIILYRINVAAFVSSLYNIVHPSIPEQLHQSKGSWKRPAFCSHLLCFLELSVPRPLCLPLIPHTHTHTHFGIEAQLSLQKELGERSVCCFRRQNSSRDEAFSAPRAPSPCHKTHVERSPEVVIPYTYQLPLATIGNGEKKTFRLNIAIVLCCLSAITTEQ